MEIEGKIIQILPLQSGVSSKGEWKKQDFILETQDQYPKKVCISAWNSKIQVEPLLNTSVKISINIESREYSGRWYTDVKAWKIESRSEGISLADHYPTNTLEEKTSMNTGEGDDSDDLPF
jgi:hypothetical protein